MKGTIKCYYNKNLNMSSPKLAAQVAHAVTNLVLKTTDSPPFKIVVLEARAGKMRRKIEAFEQNGIAHYVQVDLGFTEVEAGTQTVLAYWGEV